ncbi:quinone oxidoreductase-like protein 2 [Nilaparvata lugens]|uniref:quinone oxidoreductase-like protein 2 n=1 Tax=Nilaparvata lugens TaxID=108931 RepID=UPI00193EA468|nr:quinone oxidoreductase-like protein 2 [Nilaparvata lugens]
MSTTLSLINTVLRVVSAQKTLKIGLKTLANPNYFAVVRHASCYRAAVLKAVNEPLVIEDVKQVKLKKGQVRIKVEACAVNVSDLLMYQGVSPVQPSLPFVPGFEISGQILEANLAAPVAKEKKAKQKENGKQTTKDNKKKKDDDDDDEDDDDGEFPLQNGDRVIALSRDTLSGFAEECVVDVKDVWRIPSSLSFSTAAGLADAYALALLGLARRACIKANNLVLITTGVGGLGLAAIDVASNVYKAKVIGMCKTEKTGELLRQKGAWSAITFGEKGLKKKVAELSGKLGVDTVFETVGDEVFNTAIHSVAHEGKVIVAGFASQKIPDIPMSELLTLPSFSLIGVSLRDYRETNYNVYRQLVYDVLTLHEQDIIKPVISKEFKLEQVNEALKHLAETETIGKIILTTSSKK